MKKHEFAARALHRIQESVGAGYLMVGPVKWGKKLSSSPVTVLADHWGRVNFRFLAGELTAPAYYRPVPPDYCFSSSVQLALKFFEEVTESMRLAVFTDGKTERYTLELVVVTEGDQEAILAVELIDRYVERVEIELFVTAQDLAGAVVLITNEEIEGRPGVYKMKLVYVGTFQGFIESRRKIDPDHPDTKIMLRRKLFGLTTEDSVYRLAPPDDWTDTVGYFIVGEMAAGIYQIQSHEWCGFEIIVE